MTQSEKKELLLLVPQSIRTSRNYTETSKLLLGYLLNFNGMNKSINDGYFFKTNADIIQCLGITEQTLIRSINILISNGIISRKAGKRGEASEYRILLDNTNTMIGINHSISNTINHSNNHSDNNDIIYLMYNELKTIRELLENQIIGINHSNNHSNSNTINHSDNHSTDTDIESDTDIELDKDKELEIESELEINNINNILEEKLLVEKGNVEVLNEFSVNEENINADSNVELESVNGTNVNDKINITAESFIWDSAIITNVEKNNIIPQQNEVTLKLGKAMNQTQYDNAHKAIDKLLKCTSIDDFEDKLEKLIQWLERHPMNEFQARQISPKLLDITRIMRNKLSKMDSNNQHEVLQETLKASNVELVKNQTKVQETVFKQTIEQSNDDEYSFLDEIDEPNKKKNDSNIPTKDFLIGELDNIIELLPKYETDMVSKLCINKIVEKYESYLKEFNLMEMVDEYKDRINVYFEGKQSSKVDDTPTLNFSTKNLREIYSHNMDDDFPTPIEEGRGLISSTSFSPRTESIANEIISRNNKNIFK